MSQTDVDLRRYKAQQALFSPLPSRLELQQLQLDGSGMRHMAVNVWRNHAIEPILTLAGPYHGFGRIQTTYNLSGYDDSLLFEPHREADVELLWLDSGRYLASMPFDGWLDWLRERILALRATSPVPILLATWLDEAAAGGRIEVMLESLPDCHFADIGTLGVDAGMPVTDVRSATFSGTRLNGRIHTLLARKLACHWLPASALPPIKAVAVDLDQTLYAGVLGEDGVTGIRLTKAHSDLQEMLAALRQRGIFLGVVSRNERQDVEKMFAAREDFPLRWSDFSVKEVSWQEKATALAHVAELLRIAPDALLYVDDNPGELAAISELLPEVHTLHATDDARLTRLSIEYYPGLWRWRTNADDGKRIADLTANELRHDLLKTASDNTEYFRSLAIDVVFCRNPKGDLVRLAALSGKTNQFNLALRRFTQTELAEWMERTDACVVAVRLKDRLADSGIVAVLVASKEANRLKVEELCISCRALGRRLEDAMVFLALRGMSIAEGCHEIVFRVAHGPRNQPALEWLRHVAALPDLPAEGELAIPSAAVLGWVVPEGITFRTE